MDKKFIFDRKILGRRNQEEKLSIPEVFHWGFLITILGKVWGTYTY